MTRRSASVAPPIGQLVRDRPTGRRLRVGDVDATHVIAEEDGSAIGEAFRRVRTTRIQIARWTGRVDVESVPDPVTHWRDDTGRIHRISELDVQTLSHTAAAELQRDSRDDGYDHLVQGHDQTRLPQWIAARVERLGLVELGATVQHRSHRAGLGTCYDRTPYQLTALGAQLLWVIRDDITRCRVCGCTEDRACPGGCWWVPDPLFDDLCSACPPVALDA